MYNGAIGSIAEVVLHSFTRFLPGGHGEFFQYIGVIIYDGFAYIDIGK
jgi:hypothetical protein